MFATLWNKVCWKHGFLRFLKRRTRHFFSFQTFTVGMPTTTIKIKFIRSAIFRVEIVFGRDQTCSKLVWDLTLISTRSIQMSP